MQTITKTFPDGTVCRTGPTCHLHAGLWNPGAKLNEAFDTNTFSPPKVAEVNGFFGDKVISAKPTPKKRLSKEEWLAKKKEELAGYHEELEEQIENLKNDANWKNYLDSMSKFHTYSFGNQLLIMMQKPDATRVAGFNKWKELGRSVKKGESSSISILAPKMAGVERKDANGNLMRDAQGKIIKTQRCIGFTGVKVFDISQTEGDALPSLPKLSETPPAGFKEDMESAVQSYGYTVEYNKDSGRGEGFTSKTTKKVVINEALNDGQKASVLAHELGHIAAGHMDRTDYHTGHGGGRSTMEVEAESISYVLCRSNGMTPNVGTESKSYVAGWSRINVDKDVIKQSGEKVANVVSELLKKHSWRNAIDL